MSVQNLVEVKLKKSDDFLKVKETLTRIGISASNNTLFQSCHILHKRGRYYIVHFKEMFLLDGRPSDLSEQDIQRRNRIVNLLDEWKLVEIVDKLVTVDQIPINLIKIVPYGEKHLWLLKSKYTIGNKSC